jgi:hypothetical protein
MVRRISPICPKCKKQNTYDIIPGLPDLPEVQLSQSAFDNFLQKTTEGNAKYHCMDCSHTWKKYRGKKPYNRIKLIFANVVGYPGPYFHVKVNLESMEVEASVQRHIDQTEVIHSTNSLKEEEIECFRFELFKCDFLNWAEEYNMFAMDGTHWSVRIEYNTHCEIKSGSNHFPPKWSRFCKAVAKVSESEFH